MIEFSMDILSLFAKEDIKSVHIGNTTMDEIIVNRGGKNYRIWIAPEEERK